MLSPRTERATGLPRRSFEITPLDRGSSDNALLYYKHHRSCAQETLARRLNGRGSIACAPEHLFVVWAQRRVARQWVE
jgi:hypothetical protein